jgi:hypothetical protein
MTCAEMLGDVDFDSPVDADVNGHGNPGDTNIHGNGPQNVHGNDPGNTVHGGRLTHVWAGRPAADGEGRLRARTLWHAAPRGCSEHRSAKVVNVL